MDAPTEIEAKRAVLLVKQRRLLAGQLRITTEERQVREELATLVPLGVSVVTMSCVISGSEREFEVRPYLSSRDGKRRVKILPLR